MIEQGLRSPATTLNRARRRVIEVFSRRGKTPRPDGMDCALCLWDKSSGTITFAGARRPLYLYRSKDMDLPELGKSVTKKEGIIVISGDKMSVGYEKHVSLEQDLFSELTFKVYPQDLLYICSDGYAD